jgi:hypothetical protein
LTRGDLVFKDGDERNQELAMLLEQLSSLLV